MRSRGLTGSRRPGLKKVAAFIGTGRQGHTHDAVRRFLNHLESFGNVESEVVRLGDHQLKPCIGCKQCFQHGEASCPLKDDRDILIAKMEASDGVVFASPSYLFQVTGTMKTFLDRLSFFGHRPRFFGKTFTSIVTQGLPFDAKIGKYLNLVGSCFGYKTVAGSRITALDPMTEKEERAVDDLLQKHATRFHKSLTVKELPAPSLVMLAGFRIGRTTMSLEQDEKSYDYRYYREKDWLNSDYFYPVRLGPAKRALGFFLDMMGRRMARKR
jgi:NAD(P)H-dependent FMN reductase